MKTLNIPDVEFDELIEDDSTNKMEPDALERALMDEKGSRPLANQKHERFVRAIFGGTTQVDAYLENISDKAKRTTAKTEARRLLKKPEVEERLHYLTNSIQSLDAPVTRLEAIKACTGIMRDPDASPDNKLKAIDRLGKMFKWFDAPPVDPTKVRPDPAYLHQYLKTAKANHDAISG